MFMAHSFCDGDKQKNRYFVLDGMGDLPILTH